MDSFEWNKVFAAVLVAGIVASLSGFIAGKLVHPEAVTAHGPEAEAGAAGGAAPAAMPEPVLHLVAVADPAQGQKLFRACAACHTADQGGPHGIGPNLWNIMNRGAGKAVGFAYSGAVEAVVGESWEYTELNRFIWKPKTYAPGTKMNYIGLKKPEDRAAIIAYLRTLSDNPVPPPTEIEIAAETAELSPTPEETTEGPATEGADAAEDAATEPAGTAEGATGGTIPALPETSAETETVTEPEDSDIVVPPATDEGQ